MPIQASSNGMAAAGYFLGVLAFMAMARIATCGFAHALGS
jgi:hypothetical protein